MSGLWTDLLPGVYFNFLGLWWMFRVACSIATLWKSNGTFKTYSWFPAYRIKTLEPWISIIYCGVCAIIELATGSEEEDSSSGHLGMYCVIIVLSIIQLQEFYRKGTPAPYEFLFAMVAFIIITLENYSHLKEKPITDATLHSQIIYLTILVAVSSLMEFLVRDHPVIGMVRAAAVFLLGLNLIHTALLLYPPIDFLVLDLDSHQSVTKASVIFIFEFISVALPLSVIIIGLVVDFYDNYL